MISLLACTADKCCFIGARTACCSSPSASWAVIRVCGQNSTPTDLLVLQLLLLWVLSSSVANSVLTLSVDEGSIITPMRACVSHILIHLSFPFSFPASIHLFLQHWRARQPFTNSGGVLSEHGWASQNMVVFLLSLWTCFVEATLCYIFTVCWNDIDYKALYEIEFCCQDRHLYVYKKSNCRCQSNSSALQGRSCTIHLGCTVWLASSDLLLIFHYATNLIYDECV